MSVLLGARVVHLHAEARPGAGQEVEEGLVRDFEALQRAAAARVVARTADRHGLRRAVVVMSRTARP